MIDVTFCDQVTQQETHLNPKHATMRRTPEGDYCFSIRIYGITKFEIDRLKCLAKTINKENEMFLMDYNLSK